MAEYPDVVTTFAPSDTPMSDGFVVFGNIFNADADNKAIIYVGDQYVRGELMYGWRYHLIGGTPQNIETGYFAETSPSYAEISGTFKFEVD